MEAKTIIELINEAASGKIPKNEAEQTFSVLFRFGRWRKEEELALFTLSNAGEMLTKYLECGKHLQSKEAEQKMLSLPNAKELFDICLKNGYVFHPKTVMMFLSSKDQSEYLDAVIDQGWFMGYAGEDIVWSEGFEQITQMPDAGRLFIKVLQNENRMMGRQCLWKIISTPWVETLPEEEHIEILRLAFGKQMYPMLKDKSQGLLLHKLPECVEEFIEHSGVFNEQYVLELFNGEHDDLCKKYIEHCGQYQPAVKKAILARQDADWWIDFYAKQTHDIKGTIYLKWQRFISVF